MIKGILYYGCVFKYIVVNKIFDVKIVVIKIFDEIIVVIKIFDETIVLIIKVEYFDI